jgi:hypothetical protein
MSRDDIDDTESERLHGFMRLQVRRYRITA